MKNIRLLSENFHFLMVKFTVYLNRHVFVMGNVYDQRDKLNLGFCCMHMLGRYIFK